MSHQFSPVPGSDHAPKPPAGSRVTLWILISTAIVGLLVGGAILGSVWTARQLALAAAAHAAPPVPAPPVPSATPTFQPHVATPAPVATPTGPEPVLRIVSTNPPSPATLKTGERMTVKIHYENPGPGSVQIFARPWTNGQRTPGYGAHPSGGYPAGSGEIEGWFTFSAPSKVDEVHVEMIRPGNGQAAPLATATMKIQATWVQGATAAAPLSIIKPAKDSPLYRDGAFGFPQKEATVFCDTDQLGFSGWSNRDYFLAQAILWQDGDSALGTSRDGRSIGDSSQLMFQVGEQAGPTVGVDRTYMLNPWPNQPGLRYQTRVSQNAWTFIKSDTAGRGAIRYVSLPSGVKVRVDTYAVPLKELGKASGDTIRVAFSGQSQVPAFTVRSAASDAAAARPANGMDIYSRYALAAGHDFDLAQLPDGKSDAVIAGPTPSTTGQRPAPAVAVREGDTPEIKFKAVDGRDVDLARLKGKVVLIDFWATWCGPCVGEIPHVVEAYNKYHEKGFEIIGISFDSDRAKLEQMTQAKQMPWPQFFDGSAWKNPFGQRYGIHGIPTMWLVNKQGKLASLNARRDLAGQVEKLLAE